MIPLAISAHGAMRYRERIANLSPQEISCALMTPHIMKAVDFGAHYIRLGSGHRLVIMDRTLITVLPPEIRPGQLRLRP